MKLPAFSGRKKSINLLPKDPFESSSIGVILEWALAFGKWAVILTQLIVMAAFLWRFGLDRRLTNLGREIDQEKAVISSYSQIETDFLLAQKRIEFLKPAMATQSKIRETMQLIENLTPPDVWYEKLSVAETEVAMTAYSGSLSGFSRLLTALQRRPEFKSVIVSNIEDGGATGAELRFEIALGYGLEEGKKK